MMASLSAQNNLDAKQNIALYSKAHQENAKRTDKLNARREQLKLQHCTNGRALPLPESGCRKIAVAFTRVSI